MDNLTSDYSESDEADDEAEEEVPESSDSDSEQSDLVLSSDADDEDDFHVDLFSDDENDREDLQPRKSCDDDLDDEDDEKWRSWLQETMGGSSAREEPPAVNDSGSDDEIVVRKDGAGRTYNRRRHKQRRPPRPSPKAGSVVDPTQAGSDEEEIQEEERPPGVRGDPIRQCSEQSFVEGVKTFVARSKSEKKELEKKWTSCEIDHPPICEKFENKDKLGLHGDPPTSIREMFRLIFPDSIFEKVVKHTNDFANQYPQFTTVNRPKEEHSEYPFVSI